MVEKGETVKVHVAIAEDGSGYSMSPTKSLVEARVIRTPEETYLGDYHLIVELETLKDVLDITQEQIEERLKLEEDGDYFGYSIHAKDYYIEEE